MTTSENEPSVESGPLSTEDASVAMNDGALDTFPEPSLHPIKENEQNTNDEQQQVQEFLRRLPPMEHKELQTIVNAFLSIRNEDDLSIDPSTVNSAWTESAEEVFWKDYNIRTCHPTCDDEPKGKGGYTDEVRYLREQISTYQTSHYGNKDGVTARFTVTEALLPSVAKQRSSDARSNESDETVESPSMDSEKSCLLLYTYVEHLDAANGNAGYWQGSWIIRIQNETQANINGCVHLHTRAAECGSQNQIQSQARRSYQATVSTQKEKVNSIVAQFEKSTLSYAEKLMTKVVQDITAHEAQFYRNMEQWFQEPQEDGLRKLRRILPITKTRFKWDSSAQRNIQLLNARKVPTSKSGPTE